MSKVISSTDQFSEKLSINLSYSHAVLEIVSSKPSFMVRYGTFTFFIILCSICTACWFIQYPDTVNINARLTSINAPKAIVTLTEGKLVQLNVKENDSVTRGAIIGWMESVASPEQVIDLSNLLDTISILLNNNQSQILSKISERRYNQLGELQVQYQTFIQAYTIFSSYLNNGFYLKKKEMLSVDLLNLEKLHDLLIQQKNLQQQDITLSQKTFDVNDTLKKENVISDLEYRNEKSKLLNKQLTMPQLNTSVVSNESLQNDKQKEILELANTIAQQSQIFQEALNTMKSQTENWIRKYMLIAPVSGRITFVTFLQQNQQLKVNETICYITPQNNSYYAEILIPQSNFGKVEVKQRVLLKFQAYPYNEFGIVEGSIDFISKIPTDSGYLAKVVLPNGLITTYKKQILYRDGLTANGDIITGNMRLLQRIYYTIYKQIKS